MQKKDDIVEQFHGLEKQCVGYENFIECDDEHYKKTLEGLRKLIANIKRQSIFSENESLDEI